MRTTNLNVIREILLRHWDPIGICDVPEAADEYDHYAAAILQMLKAGRNRDDLEAYLIDVMTSRMGLQGTNTFRDKAKRAAHLIWTSHV